MTSIQSDTHSFIVKVWLEGASAETSVAAWRGRITHVPSGRWRSFTDLAEIPVFVAPYLQQLGVPATRLGKIRIWWRRWRAHYRREW